ncbi:MAG: hypothetical protein ACRC7O_07480, partial [Fimbriiglobus sp.]
DVPKLLDAVVSFLSDADKKGLRDAVQNNLGPVVGKDKLAAVLAGIGPDWAAWATAPPANEWLPRWTLAVRLPDAPDGPVTKSVTRAAEFALQQARVKYKRSHDDQAEIGDENQAGVAVRFLANEAGFPPGFRPCFAVKSGFLVLAGSPSGIAAFAPRTDGPIDPPLARVTGRRLRDYLAKHRDPLIRTLAAVQNRPAADVAKEFAEFPEVLAAVETVEVRFTAAGDRITLTVAAETVKPLAK